MDNIPIKIKPIWDSLAESQSFEVLKELLNINDYEIVLHPRLKTYFAQKIKILGQILVLIFLSLIKKAIPY